MHGDINLMLATMQGDENSELGGDGTTIVTSLKAAENVFGGDRRGMSIEKGGIKGGAASMARRPAPDCTQTSSKELSGKDRVTSAKSQSSP